MLQQGGLNLDKLNYVMIALLPKEPDAKIPKKFMPINLINCSFKIFSKVLTLRLGKIIDRLVSDNKVLLFRVDIY